MNTSNITLEQSYQVYKDTHRKYPNYFLGHSLRDFVPVIRDMIAYSNIFTVLDYGCGKARMWKEERLDKLFGVNVTLFDPGVEEYASKPEGQFDLVICTDVMEHVPEHLVEDVLEDINQYASKAIFFNISTRPAKKILTDGTNAHATVKPAEWWDERINTINKYVVTHYTS